MGEPTLHFLMSVRVTSYRSPRRSTSTAGLPAGDIASKKLSSPDSTSSTPLHFKLTTRAAVTPLRAGIPPNTNPFSM